MSSMVRRLRRPLRSIALLSCCVLAASASLVGAQPLADKVPADALLYVGWAGANAASANGYSGSHLEAVLAESRLKDLFGSYLDQWEQQVTAHHPDAAEPFRLVRTLGAPLWKYPSAIVVERGDDITGHGKPPFKAMLLIQAGADADRLANEWTNLLSNIHDDDRPTAQAMGDIVCMSWGYENMSALPGGNDALAGNADFTHALANAKAMKSPMLVGYISAEGVVKLIEDGVAQAEQQNRRNVDASQPTVSSRVKGFLDASGLRGVKGFVGASGFDGKDWVDVTFVNAPGPREGLLTAWPDGPADPALVKIVPADATFFSSSRFDAAVFVHQMQSTLGNTDPNAQRMFNQGLGILTAMAGTNVVQNALEPMGPDWVFYNSPHVGTASVLGMVAVNKPEDPDKLRRALNAMSVSIANAMSNGVRQMNGVGQAQREAGPGAGGIRAQQIKIGDANITYLTTPFAAPAWAIEDGRLYVGFYPQTVAAAVRQAKHGGPSLVDSQKYHALIERLGVDAQTASFYDLPAGAGYNQMYTTLLMIGRYAGVADMFGPPLPEPLLPPFDTILDNLTPAGSASWQDDTGWHTKSVTPFPGANLFMEQGAFTAAGPATAGLGASIILPALNRARETANRVKSASNLRQIGQACMLYANENRGRMPDDFGQMIKQEDLVVDVFANPRTQTVIPPEARNNQDAAVEFALTNADYVYIGKGLRTRDMNAEKILAYEKPDEVTDGINILYADGHVEFVSMPIAMQQIEQQRRERGLD